MSDRVHRSSTTGIVRTIHKPKQGGLYVQESAWNDTFKARWETYGGFSQNTALMDGSVLVIESSFANANATHARLESGTLLARDTAN